MNRERVGEWVAAVGGVVLLLSLFGPWEHRPAANPALTVTRNGWLTFGPLAAVLLVLAALPLWHLGRRLRRQGGLRAQLVLSAGAGAVTVVLFGLLNRFPLGAVPGGGLHVGLVAAGLVAIGGALRILLLPARPGAAPPVDSPDAETAGSPTPPGPPETPAPPAARPRRGRRRPPVRRRPEAGSDPHRSQRAVVGAPGLRAAVPVVALRA
ncbi:MAG: hypothetical protein H0T70_06195 [Acidimicrobiia bacterium]|nr:hypothetical protein [Acidimicrobiia bacterium]